MIHESAALNQPNQNNISMKLPRLISAKISKQIAKATNFTATVYV